MTTLLEPDDGTATVARVDVCAEKTVGWSDSRREGASPATSVCGLRGEDLPRRHCEIYVTLHAFAGADGEPGVVPDARKGGRLPDQVTKGTLAGDRWRPLRLAGHDGLPGSSRKDKANRTSQSRWMQPFGLAGSSVPPRSDAGSSG